MVRILSSSNLLDDSAARCHLKERFHEQNRGRRAANAAPDRLIAQAEQVTLRLGGDAYRGGPSFMLMADETAVGAGTVTSLNGQDFSFELPDDVKTLGIRFDNDAAVPLVPGQTRKPGEDRNLITLFR